MKLNKMKKIYLFSIALAGLAMTSCDSFLDKLPDDRTELTSVEKVKNMLTSAYPAKSPNYMLVYSSDDVTDNGPTFTCQQDQDQLYHWEQVESNGNNSPKGIWQANYLACATANECLAALAKLPENATTRALRAEALLCRAYSMFVNANVFCMAYDPQKADTYLGIPYPKSAGVSVDERGTLAETYANIDADIEAALPYVSESYMAKPKYHFNVKAAYAFAARFNLYYHKYDKAIEYASKVLGNDPKNMLRNVADAMELGAEDYSNNYIQSSEPANLMLLTAYSLVGRSFLDSNFLRYAMNREITLRETFWANMPWTADAGSANNCLYEAHKLYGSNDGCVYAKMYEMFEVTDPVSQTGFAHIVDAVFTADETLLVRAEAEALSGKSQASVDDINLWINNHCSIKYDSYARKENYTLADINNYCDTVPEVPVIITNAAQRGVKKAIHPQGFVVSDGDMKSLIYFILQLRRIETFQQGLRFQDIKRYGIEFTHNFKDADPILFTAGDLRGAIQLPIDVIDAGLEPNPRK